MPSLNNIYIINTHNLLSCQKNMIKWLRRRWKTINKNQMPLTNEEYKKVKNIE